MTGALNARVWGGGWKVAEAAGGGYCRLQVPLRLALGARETVAGRRLGALEGGLPPPLPMHLPPPPWVLLVLSTVEALGAAPMDAPRGCWQVPAFRGC